MFHVWQCSSLERFLPYASNPQNTFMLIPAIISLAEVISPVRVAQQLLLQTQWVGPGLELARQRYATTLILIVAVLGLTADFYIPAWHIGDPTLILPAQL